MIMEAPSDAVLTIQVAGTMTESVARLLSAAHLRSLAPATMNVELRLAERHGGHASGKLPALDL
jgi:hypothetical protein